MPLTNDIKNPPPFKLLISGLSVSFILLLLDLTADSIGWYELPHIFLEFISLIILVLLIAYLLVLYVKALKETTQLETEVSQWKEQHQAVLRGMSKTISHQFIAWKLTNSQKEIGLLILKGLSFKEIADMRQTSERTVRQQATEMYKKAKLKGRHEFSAFFLEGLLIP